MKGDNFLFDNQPVSEGSGQDTTDLFCNLPVHMSFCSNGGFGNDHQKKLSKGDALQVQELNELTPTERGFVFDDVHGVADVIEEEATFVYSCLLEMEDAIGKIRKKVAYNRAIFLNPTLVKDREFRLMFLRAERFEASRAAQRIVNHFAYKLALFGEEKLVKTITLDDLDDDDRHALLSGSFQFLPTKDRSGRTICFVSQNLYNYRRAENQIRLAWYQMMHQLDNDIEAQRKGLVDIVYNIGVVMQGKVFAEMTSKSYFLRDGLPFRLSALHYCYDNAAIVPAMSLVQLMLGKEGRARFRPHFGSHVECQYALLAFGIPSDGFPVDSQGRLRVDLFQTLLRERKKFEALLLEREKHQITYPRGNDVLLGRGKPYQGYSGNLLLADIIDRYRNEYCDSDRAHKTRITKAVVEKIKQSNGRFLKRSDVANCELWEEVSDSVAREKVSTGFRTKTSRQNVVVFGRDETFGTNDGQTKGTDDIVTTSKRVKLWS